MARQQLTTSILVAGLVGAFELGELAAQEFQFTGGPVEGTLVRTNTQIAEYSLDDPATNGGRRYFELASSDLTVHLNAGDSQSARVAVRLRCRERAGAGWQWP